MELTEKTILNIHSYSQMERGNIFLLIDPERPNWAVTDQRGAKILSYINGHKTFRDIVIEYTRDFNIDIAKGWLDVNTFLKQAINEEFASISPAARTYYPGRGSFLKPSGLHELWIHTNNSCNLSCSHCLVDSAPVKEESLSTDKIKEIIDEACELGVFRFFFTGGEPLIRKDIFDLIDYVIRVKDAELILLTNGTLLRGEAIKRLSGFDPLKLKLQISLDGSTPMINDPIRGQGTFTEIINGIKNSINAGFSPTVTTVLMSGNVDDLPDIVNLVADLGVKNHHFLWLHRRGRVLENKNGSFLSPERLITAVKKAGKEAEKRGITLDNLEVIKNRIINGRGFKYDLSNAGWESLCLYSDGMIYPSASFAGYEALQCGDVFKQGLKEIWLKSKIINSFREATVQMKAGCRDCYLKFLCGGGDIEHSYFYASAIHGVGNVLGEDPYCELYKEIILGTLFDLASNKRDSFNKKSGFNSPIIYTAMGKALPFCSTLNGDRGTPAVMEVGTLHSTCVLSIDIDRSREVVREFYGQAAEEPQEDLCCPTVYDRADTDHIPKEVLERFYGCGSPMNLAGLQQGEIAVDLGSGAGIDCFIAAKQVGPAGKVIGIDMTDQMLKVAEECKVKVAKNLGYDVVEFRRGFLEEIPVEDKVVDLITSNCVINLSPDKKAVFREMWRVLRNEGRILISDIVSEREVPHHLRSNERLWGECLTGALTEEEFLSYLEEAGFYGLSILKKTYWKDVEGYRFYSVTIRGYKFEKRAGCIYRGEKGMYLGPFKAIIDEEGHIFPRNESVEICTDTAEKLKRPPYKDLFIIKEPDRDISETQGVPCCDSDTDVCC
ncbi:MAG: methyltransferase domain-containing protein [Nitrospinota bacterium]